MDKKYTVDYGAMEVRMAAHLIASMPEILKTLKEVRSIVQSYLGVAPKSAHGNIALKLRNLEKVIAKIEGTEP